MNIMIPDQYVWLVWSSAFLAPWLAAFAAFPVHRKAMLWASAFTAPLGLTEPLFVPEYWDPPSLFGLAQSTGFDIESLIFSFGLGGIGAVLYNILVRRTPASMDGKERPLVRHSLHNWALVAPVLAFPVFLLLPWNPIHAAIAAMSLGAIAAVFCRPDLGRKAWLGGVLFLLYYAVFLIGLELTARGYIERIWNLDALSGLRVANAPIEELLFAAAFGAYWSVLYDHFTWRMTKTERRLGAVMKQLPEVSSD